jgi:hypothetical protein
MWYIGPGSCLTKYERELVARFWRLLVFVCPGRPCAVPVCLALPERLDFEMCVPSSCQAKHARKLGSQTGWLSIWWCANLWYLRPASGLSYYERHLVHMLFGLLASATSMWRLSYIGMRCAGDGNCTAQ